MADATNDRDHDVDAPMREITGPVSLSEAVLKDWDYHLTKIYYEEALSSLSFDIGKVHRLTDLPLLNSNYSEYTTPTKLYAKIRVKYMCNPETLVAWDYVAIDDCVFDLRRQDRRSIYSLPAERNLDQYGTSYIHVGIPVDPLIQLIKKVKTDVEGLGSCKVTPCAWDVPGGMGYTSCCIPPEGCKPILLDDATNPTAGYNPASVFNSTHKDFRSIFTTKGGMYAGTAVISMYILQSNATSTKKELELKFRLHQARLYGDGQGPPGSARYMHDWMTSIGSTSGDKQEG